MFQQLLACVVHGGDGGVGLECAGGELVREVFTCVEIFEDGGGGGEVFVWEDDGGVCG